MAVARRQPPRGLLHPSDRGIPYASGAYRALLATHGFRASMSRRGDCWATAVAEDFNAPPPNRINYRSHLYRYSVSPFAPLLRASVLTRASVPSVTYTSSGPAEG